jgi:hypothetical protein
VTTVFSKSKTLHENEESTYHHEKVYQLLFGSVGLVHVNPYVIVCESTELHPFELNDNVYLDSSKLAS